MSDSEPLPPELEAAVEPLAASVHDAWRDQRKASGWRYGRERDESARESPSLVPYEELPESEREVDRVTVRRTLKGLRALGYRIEVDLRNAAELPRAQVIAQADDMIARAQPLPAYDLTKRWLAKYPADAEVQIRNARALRRCGALHRALSVLAGIGDTLDAGGERRGLLAAVHKELFIRSRGQAQSGTALEHLRFAQQLYNEVFDQSGGTHYWHGVNAATLAALQGREEVAQTIAARVWSACFAVGTGEPTDYWLPATRGETALLQGKFDIATSEYRKAVKVALDRIGDIAAMRENALLLLDAYDVRGVERRAVENALRPPAVVVFAADSSSPQEGPNARPWTAVPSVLRAALDERLQALNAGFGFSCAAPGADLLFIEALLDRVPGVANVVLPWPREQFVATHVRPAGEPWLERFSALLGDASRPSRVHHVINASLSVGVDSPLYEQFAQKLLLGLARLHAQMLGTDVVPLVVRTIARGSDRQRATADLVTHWASQGVRVEPENVIEMEHTVPRWRARVTEAAPVPAAPYGDTTVTSFRVMAILFADVEDYSKIPEERLPAFIEYFIGGINSLLTFKAYRPENVRRVGDGLLMVFASVREAGSCALDFVEWASARSQSSADGETFWSRVGLPREMRLRVALHAGPVFECMDPLTRAPAFEGAHINYAARIEPITPGNQVYASEAFACLAAHQEARSADFVCEYVGRTSFAKRFGEYPLYHVWRP